MTDLEVARATRPSASVNTLTIAAIETAAGERPYGWYTGRFSPNTRRLVAEEGGYTPLADDRKVFRAIPDEIKKHIDLNSGNDRGRIYRIVRESGPLSPLSGAPPSHQPPQLPSAPSSGGMPCETVWRRRSSAGEIGR